MFKILSSSSSAVTGRGRMTKAFVLAVLTVVGMGYPPIFGASAARAATDRSYELVSPADKDGIAIDTRTTVQSSPDGEVVAYSAPGAFAGAQTSLIGGYYLGRRTGAEWTVEPLDAAQSNQVDRTATPSIYLSNDLSRMVQFSTQALTAGAVEGGGNLFYRDNITGERTLVAGTPGTALGIDLAPFTSRVLMGAAADLSHFVFTASPQLLPSAAPGTKNVYETTGGAPRLVNVLPDGSVDPGGALIAAMARTPRPASADGQRIVFQSPGAWGQASSLYLRIGGATTIPLSGSQRAGDPPDPQAVTYIGSSADGGRIFFASSTPLTDGALGGGMGFGDMYRYDVDSRQLTQIAVPSDPLQPTDVQKGLLVSDDGAYVYFVALGDITGGATQGASNLYVAHGGSTSFIGALTYEEQAGPNGSAISPNGRFLEFVTRADVTADDHRDPSCGAGGICAAAYLYDAVTGDLRCISCAPAGRAQGDADMGNEAASISQYTPRFVSDDGRVYFNSRASLVPEDVNGKNDVYEWRDGSVSLISAGTSDADSSFADASLDGRDVFFFTAQQLVAGDFDRDVDVYDARRGGGIASQNQAPRPAASCAGDGCQGPMPPADDASAIGSVSFVGSGNVASVGRPGGRVTVKAGARAVGASIVVAVRVPARGRLAFSGALVRSVSKQVSRAATYSVHVNLTAKARRALLKRKKLSISIRVTYIPAAGATSSTTAVLTATAKGSR